MSAVIKPGPQHLTLGGAQVFFKPNNSGYRSLGNIVSFAFNRSVTELEHFTSKDKTRLLDKSLTIQASLGCTFTIDEFENLNLNDIFFGDGVSADNQASSSVVDESFTSTADVFPGRFIFTSFRHISNVVVVNSLATGTTYATQTDYIVDNTTIGAIQIVDGGSINTTTSLVVDYDYALATYSTINPGKTFKVEGEAKVIWQALNGASWVWTIPNASLRAMGDTSFLPDNWSECEFELAALRDTTVAGEPYGTIRVNQ